MPYFFENFTIFPHCRQKGNCNADAVSFIYIIILLIVLKFFYADGGIVRYRIPFHTLKQCTENRDVADEIKH